MREPWSPPKGHSIDEARARALMGGDLGDAYRQVIMGCCRPIFWFGLQPDAPIFDSGTVTFLQTPSLLLGVTAAHVFDGYTKAKCERRIRVQISNAVVDDLEDRLIDIDRKLDVATFDLSRLVLGDVGKGVSPLRSWPPVPPEEGRGIMLGGYPSKDREPVRHLESSWGLFTAIGIARTVSHDQITWIAPDDGVLVGNPPPRNQVLGGISGGPLIAAFESKGGLMTYRLAGVISEAQAALEYVIARRVDRLQPDGTLR